jgi:N6-adenosine-specific RNA methylase IME4
MSRSLPLPSALLPATIEDLFASSMPLPVPKKTLAQQAADELKALAAQRRFKTVMADPPWRFQNRTGKMAPEHKRLSRYGTMDLPEIMALPVSEIVADTAHLYLWVPNALLPEGLEVMKAWGFSYKSNIVWHKIRKDGGPDGRGVGFYFRNVTELLLFGVRGKNARTLDPGRTQVNFLATQKREHSRKPDEQYPLIEACSPGPFLEMFARGPRKGWSVWGNQSDDYAPTWNTYANHSQADRSPSVSPRAAAPKGEPVRASSSPSLSSAQRAARRRSKGTS